MAILRGRHVDILRRADEIDNSTFQVVNPQDQMTEYAKMGELEFTQKEADEYVKPILPTVNIVKSDQPKVDTPKVEVKKGSEATVKDKK